MVDRDRKRYLVIQAVRYLRRNPYDTQWFDGTECDGGCLADDLVAEWDIEQDEIDKLSEPYVRIQESLNRARE